MTAARQAADADGGGEVHALLLGAPGIAARAAELGRYGADLVFVVEHAGLERYNPEALAATAAERIRSGGYRAAFFPPRPRAATWPRASRRALGVSLASDVTGFELQGDTVIATASGLHRQGHRHPAAQWHPGAGLAAPRGHHRRRAAADGAGRSSRSRRSIPRSARCGHRADAAHGRAARSG